MTKEYTLRQEIKGEGFGFSPLEHIAGACLVAAVVTIGTVADVGHAIYVGTGIRKIVDMIRD